MLIWCGWKFPSFNTCALLRRGQPFAAAAQYSALLRKRRTHPKRHCFQCLDLKKISLKRRGCVQILQRALSTSVADFPISEKLQKGTPGEVGIPISKKNHRCSQNRLTVKCTSRKSFSFQRIDMFYVATFSFFLFLFSFFDNHFNSWDRSWNLWGTGVMCLQNWVAKFELEQ